jgi:penicillin amidase
MLAALPAELRARFDAYRDGVNTWIQHVTLNPLDLPGEYAAVLALPIEPWTVDDSVAIGVFLARTVPSGDGRELANLRALRELGNDGFQKMLPHSVPGQLTTFPKSTGRFPSQPGQREDDRRRGFKRTVRYSKNLPLPRDGEDGTSATPLFQVLLGHARGSSMFAIQRKSDRHAFLFNGPQLGFAVPELFVEFELHKPGFDIRGVTAPGVPVIGIGHNNHVAWGFTSGLSDEDDLYAEQLVDEGSEKYRYDGKVLEMDCRNETFAYKSPATDLLGGSVPESGTETHRICRTVHGPVQARAGSIAYARKYAIWMRDVETLEGIAMLNEASSVYDVDAAMQRVTWNENVMAADDQGNIGFWHPGLHPWRPKGWDERLPFPGTGEAEWRGTVPRRNTPHVINPKQGWLANWNNPASVGWMMGDAESTEKLGGPFHRVGWLMRLVRSLGSTPTFESVQDVIKQAGTTAQQRPLASTRLKRARKGSTGDARKILDALLAWDGSYTRVDANGTVDPGVAIWEEFKDQAERVALDKLHQPDKLGDGVKDLAGGTGSSHMFDISSGEAYALRTLKAADYRKAAAATFAKVADRFKTQDIDAWREPRRLYNVAAQGGGSVENFPFFDRGTWEQFVELGP